MPAPDASTPAGQAIEEFGWHLTGRGLSATTRRIRVHFLREYLRHVVAAASDAAAPAGGAPSLTAGDLMDPALAAAWLADAAAGKTRTRGTARGREAAAYPNSMRARADTWNGFAEFLGLPARLPAAKPADGFRLPPAEAEQLVHDLAVRRPVTANAATALRTAAVAALVADTGRGVPELAGLTVGALHLSGGSPSVKLGDDSFRLGGETVQVVSRWLSARAAIIAELEGSDPGFLWIPVKPGRPRGGDPPVKPGLVPAAVRTLHHAHRLYVSQMLGTPLRPGTLRALHEEAGPAADAPPP
jgi:site-specific recombinase XerC